MRKRSPLEDGAKTLAVRNSRSLRFLEQLVQQPKLRGVVRPAFRYVNFVERDRHADTVSVRIGNLRTLQSCAAAHCLRQVKLPHRYPQLRAIRFACGECGKSETAWRA